MSAQFSKGDKVRKTTVEHTVMGSGFMDHGEQFAKKGAVGTITDVEGPAIMWVEWDEGTPSRINVEHLEQVEPEFVVGQQVKDEDYDRLPVGAKAGTIEKTGEHEWRDLDGRPLFQSPHATRHLNYLPEQLDPEDDSVEAYCVKDAQDGDWWVSEATPEFGYGIVYSDGTHPTKTNDLDAIEANYGIDAGPEPEDKDDLYVEPEPLKEGDPNAVTINTLDREEIHRLIRALAAKRVRLVIGPGDSVQSETISRAIEALREFANPKPARCTSVHMPGARSFTLHWCEDTDGHAGDHGAGFTTWTDAEAHGRVEVSS